MTVAVRTNGGLSPAIRVGLTLYRSPRLSPGGIVLADLSTTI